MKPKRFTHPKITTKDSSGEKNGYLVPIFNINESPIAPAQYPQQVYLTVVSPGKIKGPHLHYIRWGLFTCIKGDVKIIIKTDEGYDEHYSGEHHEYATIQVPPTFPAAVQNIGEIDAFILNMPSPAWHKDQNDEHTASFEGYKF